MEIYINLECQLIFKSGNTLLLEFVKINNPPFCLRQQRYCLPFRSFWNQIGSSKMFVACLSKLSIVNLTH